MLTGKNWNLIEKIKSKKKGRFLCSSEKCLDYLFLVFLPALVILPWVNKVPFPSPDAQYTDFATTHLSNLIYLKTSIITNHSIPLWTSAILSGYPFYANPLSGVFYPFTWVALLFGNPVIGLNFVVFLHLVIGGIGMMWFLKLNHVSTKAAFFGGAAFSLMPKIFAHYGAGHVSLLYAVSLTPWLLAATQWSWDDTKFPHVRDILPGIILAIIFYADVRWAVYSVGLWGCYEIAHSHLWVWNETRQRLKKLIKRIFYNLILFLLLIAPLLLPMVEYTRLSTRSLLKLEDSFIYSLPISQVINLFFPENYGFHEWAVYTGSVILLLALGAIALTKKNWKNVFWIMTFVFTLLFAFGKNFPLNEYIFLLPGFRLLRVPPRSLFIFGMSTTILASFMLDRLLNGPSSTDIKRFKLLISGTLFFVMLLSLAFIGISKEFSLNIIWSLVVFSSSVLLIFLYIGRKIGTDSFFVLLVLICLVDLLFTDYKSFNSRYGFDVSTHDKNIVEMLSNDSDTYRVYSPSYSISQENAAKYGLELAYGVDPIQLMSYSLMMEKATGVPSKSYSVTLPPFDNGEPSSANKMYTPYAELLGLLNVKYIVAEFDIRIIDFELIKKVGNSRIYKNKAYRPRAWVESALNGEVSNSFYPVEQIKWMPNHIHIETSGSGKLVLSEISYPGWVVRVDGKETPMMKSYGLLRSVELGAGSHNVDFYFIPKPLYLGLFIGLFSVLWVGYQLRTDIKMSDERKGKIV